jgi:lipopolysaccharide/colanic/teichoic acid biosynthesis glycosyltransferase
VIKRLFDFLCSAIGVAVLSPLLLWISWEIKREDGGPVFYRGARVGLHGRLFRIYKFRTMVADAEKRGPSSTSAEDPRITRIGQTLRKYKLDELPQLINVLAGDMSFVGPRPEVQKFTDLYTDEEKILLTVRPGITDWASLWNSDEGALLKGSVDPDRDYLEKIRPTKIALQLKYVRERTFWNDLKLIFLTLFAIVAPESPAVDEIRNKAKEIY